MITLIIVTSLFNHHSPKHTKTNNPHPRIPRLSFPFLFLLLQWRLSHFPLNPPFFHSLSPPLPNPSTLSNTDLSFLQPICGWWVTMTPEIWTSPPIPSLLAALGLSFLALSLLFPPPPPLILLSTLSTPTISSPNFTTWVSSNSLSFYLYFLFLLLFMCFMCGCSHPDWSDQERVEQRATARRR